MSASGRIAVLLTVPHLSSTASPYPEMSAIAKYLPRDQFRLSICSLTPYGYAETRPDLEQQGVDVMVARFRPAKHRPRWGIPRQVWHSVRDERLIQARGPFDLQHSLDYSGSPFEALMAYRAGRPFLFSQRNLNQGGRQSFLRLKIRLAERCLAISEGTERVLLAHGAERRKVRKVLNGIDLDGASAEPRTRGTGEGPVLLFVGHVQRLKRHEDAIKTAAMLRGEWPNLRLRIAGNVYEPAYRAELEQLVRSLGLTAHVEFLGVRTDIPDLMRAADVLLLCSSSEALPSVLLEAVVNGLPVVASNVDGPREILEPGTGVLVEAGDVQGYGRAVRWLLANPDERVALARRAWQSVAARFSAKRMVEELAAEYRDVAMANRQSARYAGTDLAIADPQPSRHR